MIIFDTILDFHSVLIAPWADSNMNAHVVMEKRNNNVQHSSTTWSEKTAQVLILTGLILCLFLVYVLTETIN